MLVRTEITGERSRKEPSLSSASTTMKLPLPSRAFVPSVLTLPPTTIVGSKPPCESTLAIIEVVVVLPWLPATAMPYLSLMSSASIWARGITGMLFFLASTTSGFLSFTADDMTITPEP